MSSRQSYWEKWQNHPGNCGQVWCGACSDRRGQREKAAQRGGKPPNTNTQLSVVLTDIQSQLHTIETTHYRPLF